ncbi:MAG: endonuclease/exonuclease/phosphatase family protein [Bacteroidetes bacterium]|nr:endonuclease/exonuclease/phosphatase family protein [Bacteroidota bacterium]MCL1969523.1 endonuclease/exonuclease/phosphatase family protein [Bacteroidota bacterium]MCL1969657.1 endonuclease/exonuclease/phosphatase family protein [Bacteroidota bacterium]
MFRKKITPFLIIFLLFALFCSQAQKTAIIGFYNVENLYDTEKDPITNDNEFLPNSTYQWTTERYNQKLKNLAYAISEIGKEQGGVVVLGMSEIENARVLNDLVAQDALKPLHYKVAHHDGPDLRGVDVAFIYQGERFEFISQKPHTLTIPDNPTFKTRDQLLLVGVLDKTDTLYLIVNHWPSKRGGEARSAPLRMAAAQLTRSIADSLLKINANAKIVIMGDLNDNPNAKSIMNGLNAKGKMNDVQQYDLFNPMWKMYRDGIGSYAYQDSWDLIDQIIMSYALLQSKPNKYKFISAHVFNPNFLKTKTGSFQGYPFRTYAGGSYAGGYSDHFPVYVVLQK